MKTLRRLAVLVGASLVGSWLGASTAAQADWPVARHDAQRTATSAGSAGITQPAVYWQYYLGGTLTDQAYIATDINKDGTVEIVYLAGGKAIAKLPNDSVVWESPPIELEAIDDVVDVDGNGVLDLVAHSERGAAVISGADGHVEWMEPAGEVGTVGAVRVGDLDGDGLPEVFVDDGVCSLAAANPSAAGGVYSFAGGASTPTLLYRPLQVSVRHHCGGSAVLLGDWDGNGVLDVGYVNDPAANGDSSMPDTILLADGATGALFPDATSAGLGVTLGSVGTCDSANVDGRPGDEMVCYLNEYVSGAVEGGHGVFVVTYDTTATPSAKLLWSQTVGLAKGAESNVGASLGDLDADGTFEITLSLEAYDGVAGWTTLVFDAPSGNVLATLSGVQLAGIADVNGNGKPEILTYDRMGTLAAWAFARGASPATTMQWSLTGGQQETEQVDWAKTPLNSSNFKSLLRTNAAGNPELLLTLPATSSGSGSVAAYAAGGMQAPQMMAAYALPANVSFLTQQVFSKIDRPYDELTVTRSDGFFVVLDDMLVPTNQQPMTQEQAAPPGMRVGGFTGAPIAPKLGSADVPIVTDSRGVLLSMDAGAAWPAAPPTVSWQRPGATNPSAVTTGSGMAAILCNQGDSVTALSQSGSVVWSTPLGTGGVAASMLADALSADVNGDGVPDAFTLATTPSLVINAQVYDGVTGAPIWTVPNTAAGNDLPMIDADTPSPFALSDWDGDGVLDMWAVANELVVWNGTSGGFLAEDFTAGTTFTASQTQPTFLNVGTPTVGDFNFDGTTEVVISACQFPEQEIDHTLQVSEWQDATQGAPFHDGAWAVCPGNQSVWVQPLLEFPGEVNLTPMNGAGMGAATTLFLAGGALAATAPSGVFWGTLGTVTIKSDLLGTGTHPSALIPSSDGYLYAVNPCNGTLDWAYNLTFPPGEVIFADTNGDGVDEMLVGAADGYLYDLQQQLLQAPAYVYDVNPGMPSVDVSQVTTPGQLSAAWASVTGADAYEIAVTTAGGSFVTQPNWINVGNVTQATTPNLPLLSGQKYYQLVRAISMTKGSSPSTSSKGVVVEISDAGLSSSDAGPDDDAAMATGEGGLRADGGPGEDGGGGSHGGSKGGCSCDAVGRGDARSRWLPLAVGLVLAAVRRRRRCA